MHSLISLLVGIATIAVIFSCCVLCCALSSSDSGPRGRGSSERTERPERAERAGGERGGSGRSDPEPEKASDRPRSPPTQAEEPTKPRRDSKGGDRKIRNKASTAHKTISVACWSPMT